METYYIFSYEVYFVSTIFGVDLFRSRSDDDDNQCCNDDNGAGKDEHIDRFRNRDYKVVSLQLLKYRKQLEFFFCNNKFSYNLQSVDDGCWCDRSHAA